MKVIIALATATIFTSAFLEPAVAQRATKGNQYNQMGLDDSPQPTFTYSQFNLFGTDQAGKTITDSASLDPNLGIFNGAIENFRIGFGQLLEDNEILIRDSSGFPRFNSLFKADEKLFDVGNLRAELKVEDTSFGKLEYIDYSIFGGATNSVVQINRLNVDTNFLSKFDKNRSVNDLSYILTQDILGLTRARERPDGSKVSEVINLAPIYRTGSVSTSIPEPSITASLLSLGILGMISLRKHAC